MGRPSEPALIRAARQEPTGYPVHHVEEPLLDLATRISASDERAFADLFQRMHLPLLRYAFRFTGSEAGALDVVQDVFLRLWEQRTTLAIRVSLRAFLYTMTRNRALNARRDGAREEPLVSTTLAGGEPPFTDALDARELDRWFRAWVRELPPRRAEAFVLSRYHELSHQEISTIMGLSKRTVDTHIVHALQFLKQRYAQWIARGVLP